MEAGITATDIEEAHYIMLISPTVECQKWSNVEEIGVEEILVSKEVEFFRHHTSMAFGEFDINMEYGLSDCDDYLDKNQLLKS